jgi:chromatin segregation and condensation protein Rec8/ScpA/Scc1 (kleisin family)
MSSGVSPIIDDTSIPNSFTNSVDRPFDPIGVRWLHEQEMQSGRNNERLSDEQVKALIENPEITQSTRLEDLTSEENARREREAEEIKIYNLSIKDIAHRTSDTVHDIMDDMLTYNNDDGWRGFLHIFTKSDRLMYIGILIIIFTVLLLLIKTSD